MTIKVSGLADAVLSAAPGDAGANIFVTTARFFTDGGPFMFVNLFWLAAALALVVERVVTLLFRFNLDAGPFMEQITKLVLTGNVDRAVKLCNAAPKAPLAKVVRAGLTRANRGELEVARAVKEAIAEQTPAITARIPWLWSLANLVTLVGLVGAISGLIGTLHALGDVPADQKQALLTGGISRALNNTAFALSVAVLCIISHLFLSSYAKRMVETVELSSLKLQNLLARRQSGGTPARDFEKSA